MIALGENRRPTVGVKLDPGAPPPRTPKRSLASFDVAQDALSEVEGRGPDDPAPFAWGREFQFEIWTRQAVVAQLSGTNDTYPCTSGTARS